MSKNKKEVTRYRENPFINNMIINKKNKKIQISRMGYDDNVIVNQMTGEISGTAITTYKQVDASEFVKLFVRNVALTFDLSSAGIKALNVLLFAVQYKAINKDEVLLDKIVKEDFLSTFGENDKPVFSDRTFLRGLSELVSAKIIANTLRQGIYWINPNFVFNGDRIAFNTVIERRKKSKYEKLEEQGQERLPLEE